MIAYFSFVRISLNLNLEKLFAQLDKRDESIVCYIVTIASHAETSYKEKCKIMVLREKHETASHSYILARYICIEEVTYGVI